MAQTLCIKCGSELKASSYCQLCHQPLIFACTSCDYITEEKVHPDCRNAEVLTNTGEITGDQDAAAIATKTSTTSNQKDSVLDKPKEETAKTELSSAQSHMTTQQDNNNDNDNNNLNPFAAGTVVWQNLITYWLNTYEEFFKNALKMTEEWYNIFYKPWVNWMPRSQIDID